MTDTLDAIGRGAAQGATLGWGDEAVAKLLSMMPQQTEQDGGIPRHYAAGSREADYLGSERAANAAAAADRPMAYHGSSLAAGLPSALAIPAAGGGTAAARIAAAGLQGGALGALQGAGRADGGDMLQSAARGAGQGAAFGTLGASAKEAVPAALAALRDLPPIGPSGPFGAPALATAGAGPAMPLPRAPAPSGGPIRNFATGASSVAPNAAGMGVGAAPRNQAILPPKPSSEDLGDIPRIPKSPAPLMRPSQIPASENLADATMVANSAKAAGKGLTPSILKQAQAAQADFSKTATPKTEAMTAGTVRPPRRGGGQPPAPPPPRPTVPAPRDRATMPVTADMGAASPTVPAPAGGPQTLRAPAGRPTVPAPAAVGSSIEDALQNLGGVVRGARPTVPAPRPTVPAPAAGGTSIEEALSQLFGGAAPRQTVRPWAYDPQKILAGAPR